MDNLKFSQAKEMFYNLLRAIFASGITEEEEAIFAKQLVDFILNHVNDCREKGLEEEMLPIGYVSIWQGVKPNNRGIFSIRAMAGIETNNDNNLSELLENIKKTVYAWGDKSLGGIIKLKEGESEFIYNYESESEDESEDETE